MPAFATAPTMLDAARSPRRARSATMLSARAAVGDVPVEVYAVVRARLEGGQDRAEALASVGLNETDWHRIDAAYTSLLMEEARSGDHTQGRRYATAYAEEWNQHAPRFATPSEPQPTPRESRSPESNRTLISPRRTKSGTIAMDARTLTPPPGPAPTRPAAAAPPAPIGGTVVMDTSTLAPAASSLEVSDYELRQYVAVSASLASSSNRNATLAKHAMTLQNWVDWSARMGQRLAADEALRTRYSLLLHEAIQKLESR